MILDLGREIYGIAFHPKFTENRFVFLFITERKPEPPRTRIARFQTASEPPFVIDPGSENVILEFPSNGHDGGCLKFGPDGFLYIGVGDGGNANDMHNTGQYLGDLLASILRIDVDGTHSAMSYAIPDDNPFLQTPGARPEIWAYGFRQPWKFSFDRETGDLWVGDVGQQLWEMIYKIERGGNYGWSIMEGPQRFRPLRKKGPTPIIPPVHAYQHHEGRSVTGGFVYRGQRYPDLYGLYLFADYETGRVWGLKPGGKDQLAALITAFHRANQAQLPITMFAAGLPQLLGRMGKAKSYAERLFEFTPLGPLEPEHAADAIIIPARDQGVEYEPAGVEKIVGETKGYPYFLQEWGRHSWRVAEQSPITLQDTIQATVEAVAQLDSSFFRVRFDRLPPSEKRYMRAMAELGEGPHRSGDVADVLARKVTGVAPTRSSLIRKGMAFSPSHGDIAFTVPLFDGFMKRIMALET